jgi:hypothetical protein
MDKVFILITSILFMSSAHAQGVDSQKFFSQLAAALNDPAQKSQVVEMLNEFGPEHKRNAELAMKNEFKQLESRLPIRIDEYTQLESVYVFSDAIRYNFQLSQEYLDNFDISSFKSNVRGFTRNEVCSNPRMFFMVVLDFRIIHFYYAPDNSIVKEVTITEKDCV